MLYFCLSVRGVLLHIVYKTSVVVINKVKILRYLSFFFPVICRLPILLEYVLFASTFTLTPLQY